MPPEDVVETRVFEVEIEARVMEDATDPEEDGREFVVAVLEADRVAPILAFPTITRLEAVIEDVDVAAAPTRFTPILLMDKLFPPFPFARTATGSYPTLPPFIMLDVWSKNALSH